MNRYSVILAAAMPVFLVLTAARNDHAWPIISSSIFSMRVNDADKDAVGFDRIVKDVNGKDAYRIVCGTPFYQKSKSISFSGVAQCYLFSVRDGGIGDNLLSRDPSSDWNNRGRFLASALKDGCARDALFGRRRYFGLRGLELIISVSDISIKGDKIKSYTLSAYTHRKMANVTSYVVEDSYKPKWYYHNSCF
ncbi:hypothetical protein [Sphingomonas asaccharolytica]|uniref:hypothetical protein n=1 Tax=Sphingomonas asaccharolytica TaxID=40681 RepID=UPI0012EE761F|nr:hypothetical protein [Sphingomonas asaccharolytica]